MRSGEAKVRQLLRDEFSVMEVKDPHWTAAKRCASRSSKTNRRGSKADAVDQAIKTIRNRADKYGVSEPSIAKRGQDNILIELPGVKDPNRAIEIIGKTAQLEFIMVDDEIKPLDTIELPRRRHARLRQHSQARWLGGSLGIFARENQGRNLRRDQGQDSRRPRDQSRRRARCRRQALRLPLVAGVQEGRHHR